MAVKLAAVFLRGELIVVPKGFIKGRLGMIAGGFGNLVYVHIRHLEQIFGVLHSGGQLLLPEGHAVVIQQNPGKLALGQM